MNRIGRLPALLLASLTLFRLTAQDTTALAARLHKADNESSLDSVDLKPWHLKLDVQLYDQKGRLSEQGVFEEWWATPSRLRIVYRFPSYTSTEVRTPEGVLRTKDFILPPMTLRAAIDELIHPVHQPEEIDHSRPDLRKQTFGKATLECIMLDQPVKQVAYPPLGLFPTYCLEPGKETIRASFDFGIQTTVHNQIGRFQNRTVATDVTVMSGEQVTAKAKVVTLQTSAPGDAAQQPGDVLEAPISTTPALISGAVMQGYILTKVPPHYPQRAIQNHSSGAVVLHALIGRDGRIHSLQLVSYPDPDLAIASIAAVRQWVYKPYLLNGEATEVDTTITVHFTFGSG